MKAQSQKPGGITSLITAGAQAAAQGRIRPALLNPPLPFAGMAAPAVRSCRKNGGTETRPVAGKFQPPAAWLQGGCCLSAACQEQAGSNPAATTQQADSKVAANPQQADSNHAATTQQARDNHGADGWGIVMPFPDLAPAFALVGKGAS